MAVLSSTAKKTYDYTNYPLGNFNRRVGAGIINLFDSIESYSEVYKYNKNKTSNTTIITEQVHLTAGTEIQVGLSWLVTADTSNQEIYNTDYDLRLITPSGATVLSSLSSNVELIRYSVPDTGTYTIIVLQKGEMDETISGDRINLSYTIFGDNIGHVHCYYEGDCTPNDYSTHKRTCYCGDSSIDEEHYWTGAGKNKIRCLECMLTYSGTIPGGDIQTLIGSKNPT